MNSLIKNFICAISILPTAQAVTVVLGDLGGNSRGVDSIDISTNRQYPYEVTSGQNSIGIGSRNLVTGNSSLAIGAQNIIQNSVGIGIGYNNQAWGESSILVGFGNYSEFSGYVFGGSNSVFSGIPDQPAGAYGFANVVYWGGMDSFVFGNYNYLDAEGATIFGSQIQNLVHYSTMIGPSNAAKVTILDSGNVGIGLGNTLPTAKLDVAGDIRLSGNLIKAGGGTLTIPTTSGTLVTTSGTQAITGTTSLVGGTTTLGSASNGSQQVKVDASGNVGIGTSPSAAKLTLAAGTALVGGDATGKGAIQIVSDPGSTEQSNGGIEFKSMASGAGSGFRFHTPNLFGNAPTFLLQGRSNSATWTTALTVVASTGNVGIGTTYPSAKLTVQGVAANQEVGIHVNNSHTSGYSSLRVGGTDILNFGSTYAGGASAPSQTMVRSTGLNGMSVVASHASAPIKFLTAGNADSNERMRIAADGNVGIGTSAPSSLLDVYGSSPVLKVRQNPAIAGSATVEITAAGTASDSNAATLKLHTASALWGRTDGAGLRIGTADKSATWATFDNSGNLGLGVAPVADARINVVGNAKVSGTLTVGGSSVLTTAGGSGASLTALNASQLTTGTLPAARLPSSVVQLSTSQTLTNKILSDAQFVGTTIFDGSLNVSGYAQLNGASINDAGAIIFPGAGVIMREGSSSLAIGRAYSFQYDNTLKLDASNINIFSPFFTIGESSYSGSPSGGANFSIMAGNVTIRPGSSSALNVEGKTNLNGNVNIAADIRVSNRKVLRVSPAGDIGMGAFNKGYNPETGLVE